MQDFEKLGVFYLGKQYDLKARRRSAQYLLYDSRDLVTHAVCVGMTGSGKTGLCLGILEEAAIDNIPCIAIDPKGDLTNLLLTFPNLTADEFAPWINAEEAQRKNLSSQQYAQAQADLWRDGLSDWEQDAARIQRLRASADFAVYTPGSNAGIPVSILKSFAAPAPEVREEPELLRERITTAVSSLLALLGVDADPIQSREHILISNILNVVWKQGKDVDLGALIQQIHSPPLTRIGVIDLESFFPAKDRFALGMKLNNLLAAPGFEAWLEGAALDIASILYTPAGKPRVAVFSIAHLSDSERMFFVSLLLNQILGWMRTQSGTTSLRALLYMDEIFGYFPPVANPPSKQPLLTLLKQARAFGLGVMLATQNPVDLDYKGLSNCGTWFIGRLQTERDKARVLDGLEGAAAGASQSFNRTELEQTLAALGSRVFLMHNVHEDAPAIFETRWTLSYLRGPLTRNQIKQLAHPSSAGPSVTPSAQPQAGSSPVNAATARPVLPQQISQYFLPLRSLAPAGATLLYQPALLACSKTFFVDPSRQVHTAQESCALIPLAQGVPDFEKFISLDDKPADLESAPQPDAAFTTLSPAAAQPDSYDDWKKMFAETLFRAQKLDLLHSPSLNQTSKPGESERDFRSRLAQSAREQRDVRATTLRQKYAPKMQALQERIRRAQQAVAREQAQATQSRWQSALSVGASVLGAFLGRKAFSASNIGRATTAARGLGRSVKESQDVERASENVEALQGQLAELEAQFKTDTAALTGRIDPATETFETVILRPKKSDINIQLFGLAWLPCWQETGGTQKPAWE